MSTLCVFTPTYNRAHTLPRLYRSLLAQTSPDFYWLVVDDGSTDATRRLVAAWQAEGRLDIQYIYKENGGLHTAYNAAYAAATAPLTVCVDSDDWLTPRAVQTVLSAWGARGSAAYCGLVGLDCDARTGSPIGGPFPTGLGEVYFLDLSIRRLHRGDVKVVMRTDLMRAAGPQPSFGAERHFNPIYTLLRVADTRPMLVVNECLCEVEYQVQDSMSANIFRQYTDSPRSFAELRRSEMCLRRSTWRNNVRLAAHYTASCILAGGDGWLRRCPRPWLTLLMAPAGVALAAYIKWRARRV